VYTISIYSIYFHADGVRGVENVGGSSRRDARPTGIDVNHNPKLA
jgi:hypothetical protein